MLNNMAVLTAAATTATDPAASQTMVIMQMGALVLVFVVFYFIFMRPQKKKEKETQQMRKDIQIGDELMTVGGIVGIVVRKNEDTVVIETGGDKSKLRIKIWAIQENLTVRESVQKAQVESEPKKTKKKNDDTIE